MNRALVLFLSFTVFIVSCKKDTGKQDEGSGGRFQLMERIPGELKLYDRAKLLIHQNKPFVSASSFEFGNQYSAFFFPLKDGWRRYQEPNQEFVLLKKFNGTIYGIMEYKEPYQQGALTNYRYSYFLYKWIGEAFENIARLDFTDHNSQPFSLLQNPSWFELNGKLNFVAQQTNGTSFSWDLSTDAFTDKREIGYTNLSHNVSVSTGSVAFTSYGQLNDVFDRFDVVRGYYYNGQTLEAGKQYTFKETRDGSFDDTYGYYAAIGSKLVGFKANLLRNIDADQTITELPDGLSFSPSKILPANGKLYAILGKGDAICTALGIYDGSRFQQRPFTLPADLDPCARLLDVIEEDSKLFLLLLSNRQLVVVSG